MYCPNCGRELPKDGSPCVCGQGAAQARYSPNAEAGETQVLQPGQYEPYANNNYTQPAQPQPYNQQQYGQTVQPQNQGAVSPNFTQPPQYYAQQPVQYPVQQPVRTVTPVHVMLKQLATSKVFLLFLIFSTAEIVLSVVNNSVNAQMQQSSSILMGQSANSNTNLINYSGVVPLVAAWWIYTSAKKQTPFINTTGITIFKVVEIIRIVLVALLMVLLLEASAFGVATNVFYPVNSFARIAKDPMADAWWLVAIIIGIMLGALVLTILYSAKMIRTLNGLKRSAESGVLPVKFSKFVLVCQGLYAAAGAIIMILNIMMAQWLTVLGVLCVTASSVCVLLCMMQLNRETDRLQNGTLY